KGGASGAIAALAGGGRGGGKPGAGRKVGTLPACIHLAPGLASVKGGAAGDWNRAGHAQPGEAKGPDVGGHPAPFFWVGPVKGGGARRLRTVSTGGADARRERNRGDPVSPAGCRQAKIFVVPDLIRRIPT